MNEEGSLSLYGGMLRIRRFEKKVAELFSKGEIMGFYHLYVGEEAIATGVCSALEKGDFITSTHRGHGHVLAKGARMDRMMAEMFAKATGYCGGKGGSLHIASPELGILGANGIVGAGIPIATGSALRAKLLEKGDVTVCFFGDGASNQGTFHESINIAAAFTLPVVFVCENNCWGVGTRQCDVRGCANIVDRAPGYGIPGVQADGNDVEAVREAALQAVARARSGGGPTLLEFKTFRMHMHFEGEPDTYRDREEVAFWQQNDPIERYRAALLARGVPEVGLCGVEATVERELEDAVAFARSSPPPAPESALENVYA